MLWLQLVDREAQPAVRRAGIIARDLALGMQRIDPQAHVEAAALLRQQRAETGDLGGRVEDHMVRDPADLGQVLGLVGGAIRGDFTGVVCLGQPRLPQPGGAHAVEVFPHDRRHPPHRERLHRRQYLDPRPVADIGQHGQIGAQARNIDHEGRAIDPVQVEVGEGARIAGSGFHVLILKLPRGLRQAQAERDSSKKSVSEARSGRGCQSIPRASPNGPRKQPHRIAATFVIPAQARGGDDANNRRVSLRNPADRPVP